MARKPAKRPSKDTVKRAADRAEKRSKGIEPDPVSEPTPLDPPVSSVGRPPKYKPGYAIIAKELCERGATDYDLAQQFGVETVTIWRWQVQHAEFCSAVKVAKDSYDDRVERSLAQRAVGYTYDTEKVFHHQGEITRAKIVEHVPPDPGAAKLWLTNRRRDKWRDTQSKEISGPDGKPIEVDAKGDKLALARWIAFQLAAVAGEDEEQTP